MRARTFCRRGRRATRASWWTRASLRGGSLGTPKMAPETVRERLGEPPCGFGDAFFEWVARAQEAAALDVADVFHPPLCDAELRQIETAAGCAAPSDLAAYYKRCSPWGIWRDPATVWQGMAERACRALGVANHLFPVDINSVQGNILVAHALPDDRYRLVGFLRDRGWRDEGSSIRDYVVSALVDESIV